MEYIVKDLMISVLPLRKGDMGLGDVNACGACTVDSSGPPCTCGGTKALWQYYLDQAVNPAGPAALATLKLQLRETLAAVEAREKAMHESMRPSSAAEVDILRAHLSAAIDELKVTAQRLQPAKP
jgi:hypothetical protein